MGVQISYDGLGTLGALEASGLVKPAVAPAARETPLGRLAIAFAPREETRPAERRQPGSDSGVKE